MSAILKMLKGKAMRAVLIMLILSASSAYGITSTYLSLGVVKQGWDVNSDSFYGPDIRYGWFDSGANFAAEFNSIDNRHSINASMCGIGFCFKPGIEFNDKFKQMIPHVQIGFDFLSLNVSISYASFRTPVRTIGLSFPIAFDKDPFKLARYAYCCVK